MLVEHGFGQRCVSRPEPGVGRQYCAQTLDAVGQATLRGQTPCQECRGRRLMRGQRCRLSCWLKCLRRLIVLQEYLGQQSVRGWLAWIEPDRFAQAGNGHLLIAVQAKLASHVQVHHGGRQCQGSLDCLGWGGCWLPGRLRSRQRKGARSLRGGKSLHLCCESAEEFTGALIVKPGQSSYDQAVAVE